MSPLGDFLGRLRPGGRAARIEREVRAEMHAHIEMRIEENLRTGMSREQARDEAERRFGDLEKVAGSGARVKLGDRGEGVLGGWHGSKSREPLRPFGDLAADARWALRALVRSPGFTIVSILSLALGIGFNAALFSLVDRILLRPMNVERPHELVRIYSSDENLSAARGISFLEFQDYAKLDDVFSGMSLNRIELVAQTTDNGSRMLMGESVGGGFFEMVGVEAVLGRALLPSDDLVPGGHPVTVISERFWRSGFAGDRSVVGSEITLNGMAYTIVGVIPESYVGTRPGFAMQLWLPMAMADVIRSGTGEAALERRDRRAFQATARLRPGVTLEQAASRVQAIASAMEAEYPGTNEGVKARVLAAAEIRVDPDADGPMAMAFAVVMIMVSLVLLVACANVANMLLARAASRRSEIAIRLALGAGRWRLVRQLLVESVLLATVAGLLGVAIAGVLIRLLVSFQPPLPIPISLDFAVDQRVLLYALALSWVTGVVFGLVPALRASRPDLVPALKQEEAVVVTGGRRFSARNSLVVAQVAVSLVLLVCAALLVRSMTNAQRIEPGFTIDGRVVLGLGLGFAGYPAEEAHRFHASALRAVAALPEVASVAVVEYVPLGGAESQRGAVPERDLDDPEATRTRVNVIGVGPGYFDVLEIPVLQGRSFSPADDASAARVAVVSAAAAAGLWPGEDPIGRRFSLTSRLAEPGLITVVGVHRDHKVSTLGETPRPLVYLPFAQGANEPLTSLIAVARGDQAAALAAMRREVLALDPNVPIMSVGTLRQTVEISLFPVRIAAWLIGTLGALAGLLAAIGLYGVVAYQVTQRQHEIGVRMALGAHAGNVVRMVLRQGMRLVAIGLVLGTLAAVAVTRVLAALLYGISPTDVLAFAGAVTLLASVAALANALPARRAVRVDPVAALRSE